MSGERISLHELSQLCARVLVRAGADSHVAETVAQALTAAEADGLGSHGISRLPHYAAQVRSGKVDGRAIPRIEHTARAAVRVDACGGFAFTAIRIGLQAALELLPDTGIVGVSVSNSHHAGAAGHHVEFAAKRGALALGFSNSPAGMAPWGGHQGVFGTNPIAFACSRNDGSALVIDLSLSKVARGKVMQAQRLGESIPEGWAIDAQGAPTTDPGAALAGNMLPIGEAKGAALALMVEILSAALTGSNLAFEAGSFFTADGPAPRIGQFFILIHAAAFAGDAFDERLTTLLDAILAQPGCRLPGDRRVASRARSACDGVLLDAALLAELRELAR